MASLVADAVRDAYDSPATSAETLASQAARFGLRRGEFFRWIDLHVPGELDVHVVLDNLSAHKSEAVRRWPADPKRARWQLHFTPTSASWLNLIEGWFSVLPARL